MKPNEFLLDSNQLILSSQGVIKIEDTSMDQQGQSGQFIKTSPAKDALSELLEMPSPAMVTEDSNEFLSGDANSLIVDLNDLLKRDPTLSSLSDDTLAVDIDTNFDFMNNGSTSGTGGMEIPAKASISSLLVPNNSPATWVSPSMAIPPNATVIKTSPTLTNGHPNFHTLQPQQPTLAALNSADSGIKMEASDELDLDVDDIGNYFMKNSSPNVTLGVGPKPSSATVVSSQVAAATQIKTNSGFTPHFWTLPEDSNSSGVNNPWSSLSSSVPTSITVGAGIPSPNAVSASGGAVVNSNSYNISPLSDILTDLSSNSGSTPNQSLSPNLPSNSPSQAGPTRSSTLHKLLMRKDQARQTGRPSPVRSPDGSIMRPTKTLGVMRNSLSSSNTLLTQQQLSTSAPVNHSYMSEAAAAASGSGHPRVWSRREPRPHFSSICSVGETSTLADEVNEVLGRMDPNDLQDIVSDDEEDIEDDNSQTAFNEGQTSDDDSDLEGTSPSTSKLNTSGASSSGGSKKERHFWQYNVQAKGPKGQKINFETKIDDPHVLNEIVDPVFSGEVQLQGIKHSGKARRGDGNDLTANPKKLAAIGKELDQLSKIINDLTPVSEMPFGARCKSRKEKNKLASRACRLKKKAQHEANKLKCEGLVNEHNEMIAAINKCKGLLLEKADRNSNRSQQEITEELDMVVESALSQRVAGHTSEFVNRMIERHLPYV